MKNHAYTRKEYLAIKDFLVEQAADIEEYLDDALKECQEKPSGTLRTDYQWAACIGSYLNWLCEEIKDVK